MQLGIQTDGQHGRLRVPLRRPSARCSSCHGQEPQVPPITADLAHRGQWRPRPVVQSRRGQQAAWLGVGGQVSRQHTVTGGRSAAASGIAVCPMSRSWESQQDSEPRPPGHSMHRSPGHQPTAPRIMAAAMNASGTWSPSTLAKVTVVAIARFPQLASLFACDTCGL